MMQAFMLFLTNIALGRDRGLGALFLRPILLIVSWMYGAGVLLTCWLYVSGVMRSFRSPVPVISVGNITAGGTGKTPFVAMLCRILREEGFSPMVLTRGFMATPDGISDEAEMLKTLIGPRVFIGQDRVKSFQAASTSGPFDCVVLDDGFQHWRFKRDLDIVLVDSQTPFGNGALIPRGILRETPRALCRADLIVLSRSDRLDGPGLDALKARIKALGAQAPLMLGVHRVCGVRHINGSSRIALADIQGLSGAFCAIAEPENFKRTLAEQGIVLNAFTAFADHHCFSASDISGIVQECRDKSLKNIFITHKDVCKLNKFLSSFDGIRLIVIDVEFVITYGKTDLVSSIRRLRRS